MDLILHGLLSSDKKQSLKKTIVNKIARNGSDPKQSDEIEKMFFLCFDTIVNSDDPFSLWACRHIYVEWARYNSSTLDSIFDRDRLLFLMNSNIKNNDGAIWIIHETLTVLQKNSTPNFHQLCQTIELKAISYVREHPQYETLMEFCKLLSDFKQCIPKGDLTATFCISIINAVSSFSVPENEAKVHNFIRGVTMTIGVFLKHIWTHTDPECMHKCLRAIFKVISYVDDDRAVQPCVALGGIATHIPTNLIDDVTKMTVSDTSITDASMKEALMRMFDWLNWPLANHVDVWIIAFLKGLASVHKYTILITVTETKVAQVRF